MADPTSITQYQTGFASEVAPYAQDLLGRAEALTSQTPYQPYQGEQVAQFSPLQQQSYDYAGQLSSAPQLQDATAMAGLAGLGALNTQYTFNPYTANTFNSSAAQQYMSPYMQNVVDVQQQQAKRQADIAAQTQQAQAARAGAFGGGRDAIMRSQANAELQRNLQGIQATGLQNAYQQATQQFNTEQQQRLAANQLNAQQQQFGANLGMQGLQTALQGAGTLGSLGQTQYAQNVGTIGLQNQLGLQQQQQAQNVLNTQYQNYLNEQNYPYKNLAFMSDIIRGVPLSQTGATAYQAAPSAMQNLTSLGLGAYGLSSLFGSGTGKAAGGSVNSYAGGGSVTSREFKEYAVDNVPPQMLPMVQRNAQARADMDTQQLAMEKMARDAALRRGVSGALPPGVNVVRAAGGGILAFSKGGTKLSQDQLIAQSLEDNPYAAEDEEAWGTGVTARSQRLAGLYGDDEVAPIREEVAALRKQYQGGISDQDKGLVALQMAGAMVDPSAGGNFMRGLGAAARVGGQAGAQLMAQNRQANRELLRAQAELATAAQARKENRVNLAAKLEDAARTRQSSAFEQKRDAASKAAEILSAEKRTRMQVDSQNRPVGAERIMANIDSILSGTTSYGGMTGEKGVEAYKATLGDVGAAMYGARYTGQPEKPERTSVVLKNDPEYNMLKTQRANLSARENLDAKAKARLERIDARIKVIEDQAAERAGRMDTAPTGGKGITRAQYEELPSGATFTAPDGSIRVKP